MKQATKKCTVCERNVTANNWKRHVISHATNEERKRKKKLETKSLVCSFCGRDDFANYTRRMHHEHMIHVRKLNGKVVWNKGLTKIDHPSIAKYGTTLSIVQKGRPGRKHTTQTIALMKQKGGGYRKGSGRGIMGRYKGIWCDSSWELAFLMYCEDHDIEVQRCKEKFDYVFEGEVHTYYPDFFLPLESLIVEIKGFVDERTRAKISQCPKTIAVYDKTHMKDVLNYVVHKYGKDFVKAYETRGSMA